MGARRGVYMVLLGKSERDDLEDSGVYGKIILRWILWKLDGGVDWIELAHDRDRRRALMNFVMNL